MQILYSFKAAKQLEILTKRIQERIAVKMRFFAQQSNPLVFSKYIAIIKTYRFRVGDYRIFFSVDNDTINVQAIERRDKAYK